MDKFAEKDKIRPIIDKTLQNIDKCARIDIKSSGARSVLCEMGKYDRR
ncbi:MAG: hypothetical protein H6Q74_1802 [Firmicutes bacterium]|nr:hypothetical protein [Bacillota bacterium]